MKPSEYRDALGEALVGEIKAEMGRKGIGSNRQLALAVGASYSSVNDRLSKSTRTGRRTAISVIDLQAYADALGIDPLELLRRAMAVARTPSGATHEKEGENDVAE